MRRNQNVSLKVVVIRPVPDGKSSTLFVRSDHVIPSYDNIRETSAEKSTE